MTAPANAPTRPSSPRREEILAATVRYVAEHNVSDLSLRPLAAEIGSSPRVLLYLFGSKEQLVREVLAVGRAEQLALLEQSEAEGGNARETLELLWTWLTKPERRGALRLFFEGYVRALGHSGPWQDFGTTSLDEWLPPLRRVLTGTGANPTVVLAVLRGLLLDLLADDTEEGIHTERVHTAWHAFLDAALP
ncbi:TetR/AcrR family transcriptional regulator [Streptomyces sp. 1331.2]|uniref:TetR/AcrR family transcriptional regulator n=1 Tax=Streptomyces sp. 1331.2 TaxID=1938835 RepID=UPI000BCDD07C|nr:helix-turn-helix domain-containing protein [Streptomyces sp. 1331.2]SOB88442.1 transcriptional regulator, TetR family [Streptomyces sp. 1331.2]